MYYSITRQGQGNKASCPVMSNNLLNRDLFSANYTSSLGEGIGGLGLQRVMKIWNDISVRGRTQLGGSEPACTYRFFDCIVAKWQIISICSDIILDQLSNWVRAVDIWCLLSMHSTLVPFQILFLWNVKHHWIWVSIRFGRRICNAGLKIKHCKFPNFLTHIKISLDDILRW